MNRLSQTRVKTVGYCREPDLTLDVNQVQGSGVPAGSGVFGDMQSSFIKKFLENRPRVINDLISKFGANDIIKIQVCRVAVKPLWEKLINAMSFGVLRERMRERDYDKLFHLYVIIHLDNGDRYRIEKNQRMKIIKDPVISERTECLPIDVKINLAEFLVAPEQVDMKNLYRYNAFSENCQNYVRRLLNANGITQFDDFIMQNVKDLAPGVVQSIARGITDIAGVADYIRSGGGMAGEGIYENILAQY